MQRPKAIAASCTHAMRADTSSLELPDEVVLPRQEVGAFNFESITVVSIGGSNQQAFRTTRAQPLDDPQHPHRHQHYLGLP